MANTYNTNSDTDFKEKMKEFFSNRAVVITLVTILLTLSVLVAVTVAASRSRRPVPGEVTETQTTAVTTAATTESQNVFNEDTETIPTFHESETQPTDATPEKLTFSLPVNGTMTKGHDATLQVFSPTMGDYRVHLGLDIATSESAPVYAVAAGTVEKIWNDVLMGVCVAVNHGNDTLSVYKNLSPTLASGLVAGSTVKAGQQIGTIGDTAISEMVEEPHLHFEVTASGLQVDPLDYFSEKDIAALTAADETYESAAVTVTGK